MNSIDVIRYFPTAAPERVTIDLDSLKDVLASDVAGLTVYLVSEADLARVLAATSGRVSDLGEQHVTTTNDKRTTTCLAQELAWARFHALLRIVYRSGGKIDHGIVTCLRRFQVEARPRPHVYFLVTSAKLWSSRAREARPATAKSMELHELEQDYVGNSAAARNVRDRIVVAACAPGNVVITIHGESGTGKEVIAKAIHKLSGRSGPMRVLNCGAIPATLAESELFGCERGAHSEAKEARPGLFEQAKGGTLFLDEVGDLSPEVQVKLLRVIEHREVHRLGGKDPTPIPVDVKLIVATHRDMRAMAKAGTFREDLLWRLSGYWITTPTLREHPADIDLHVRRVWCDEYRLPPLPRDLLKILRSLDWPGNVRRLEGALEALWLDSRRGTIKVTRRLLLDVLGRAGVVSPLVEAAVPSLENMARKDVVRMHVDQFCAVRPRYLTLQNFLRELVERLARQVAPHPILYASTLKVGRFAERVQRAGEGVRNPLETWRDLCGVRAVVQTQGQKEMLYAELVKYLELVPTGHSTPPGPDLGSAGFRPLEYSVRIHERAIDKLAALLDAPVPIEAIGLWGRIRLRTQLEDMNLVIRDESVPTGRPLPAGWAAQLAELEGVLGQLQVALNNIHMNIKTWAGSYGAYRTVDEAREELALLEAVLAFVPDDPSLAARAGKLAMVLGDWSRTITLLEPHEDSKRAPVLRDLGVALCKKDGPGSPEHARGLSLLEQACQLGPHDPECFSSFAGILKAAEQYERALANYEKALDVDPSDPYALGGCLEMRLRLEPHADVIGQLRPAMERAILRCRDRIEAAVALPWALYDYGKYLVLANDVRGGLEAYAKGIGRSNAEFMFDSTIGSIEALCSMVKPVRDELKVMRQGLSMARLMLAIGWCARFPSDAARYRLHSGKPARTDLRGPIVVVVEAQDEPTLAARTKLMNLLGEGLGGYRGHVVAVGAAGWADKLVREVMTGPEAERVVSTYAAPDDADLPGLFPTLDVWADLMASKVRAKTVMVLMLGRDPLLSGDRRLARELGARVAVVNEGFAEGEVDRGVVAVRTRDELESFVTTSSNESGARSRAS